MKKLSVLLSLLLVFTLLLAACAPAAEDDTLGTPGVEETPGALPPDTGVTPTPGDLGATTPMVTPEATEAMETDTPEATATVETPEATEAMTTPEGTAEAPGTGVLPGTGRQHPSRLSNMMEFDVYDTTGENLGAASDYVINMGGEQVEYLVIDVGGFLGIGSRTVLIPWDRLTVHTGTMGDEGEGIVTEGTPGGFGEGAEQGTPAAETPEGTPGGFGQGAEQGTPGAGTPGAGDTGTPGAVGTPGAGDVGTPGAGTPGAGATAEGEAFIVVDVTREMLEGAPEIDLDTLQEAGWDQEIRTYWSGQTGAGMGDTGIPGAAQTPGAGDAGTPAAGTGTPAAGDAGTPAAGSMGEQWILASSLMDLPIRTAQTGQEEEGDLGMVEDAVVNPENGEVRYIVISGDEILEDTGRVIPLPLRAFTLQREGENDATEDALILAVDRQTLQTAPAFEAETWPEDTTAENWDDQIREFWNEEVPEQ